MLVAEIAIYDELDDGTNYSPFIRQYYMTRQVLAAYWTGAFGAADNQTTPASTYVNSVVSNSIFRYMRETSLADCLLQEQSFCWDGSNVLYVHFAHPTDEWCNMQEYSTPVGFTDRKLIYIDGICYEALLRNSPSIAQQQDWLNYDQLSLVNGSFEFDNVGATFDFVKAAPIFGNEVFLYYLTDTGADDFARSALVPLAAFYVENYRNTLKLFTVDVQDLRVAQNTKIPTELLTKAVYPTMDDRYDQTPVPLAYGSIRSSAAIPVITDAGVSVTYRQALLLSLLGTVQVRVSDVWTPIVPLSSNLNRGEFTLSYADAVDSQGTPYECRVLGSIGIPITRSSDIIVDLNERYLGIMYNASNYNTTEWAAEEVALGSIGIVFKDQVELFEAVRMVQAGSNVGFRYEIAADGRRTIRISDWTRAVAKRVVAAEIENADELPITSMGEDIASEVKISYAPDFNAGTSLTVRNDDNAASVLLTYRMRTLFEHDTYLDDSAAADACALWYAGRLDVIHGITELVLRGTDKLLTRIYDVLEVELTPGFVDADAGTITGRGYYGAQKVQVLSVDPNESQQTNTVRAIIIEEVIAP